MKRIRLFIYLLCTILISILFMTAYLNKIDEKEVTVPKYTVGVVLKAMDSEHWLAVASSMEKVAQEKNINLILLYAKSESAYQQQNKIILDLLENDIDAIIISSCNIEKSEEYLSVAKSKNIPVFTLDEKIENIPYIGSDNYAIGQKAGEYLAKHLPSGASVSVISGSATQNAHIKRVQGFVDYINNKTDLKIDKCLADDTKYRQAFIQTENLLKEYPNTKGIFVTSAIMTLGTIEVVNNYKEHLQIIGVDTQNDAIMAIKNKKLDALISQDGHETGALAINVVVDYLEHKQIKTENNYIENELITIDNADNYLLQEDFL